VQFYDGRAIPMQASSIWAGYSWEGEEQEAELFRIEVSETLKVQEMVWAEERKKINLDMVALSRIQAEAAAQHENVVMGLSKELSSLKDKLDVSNKALANATEELKKQRAKKHDYKSQAHEHDHRHSEHIATVSEHMDEMKHIEAKFEIDLRTAIAEQTEKHELHSQQLQAQYLDKLKAEQGKHEEEMAQLMDQLRELKQKQREMNNERDAALQAADNKMQEVGSNAKADSVNALNELRMQLTLQIETIQREKTELESNSEAALAETEAHHSEELSKLHSDWDAEVKRLKGERDELHQLFSEAQQQRLHASASDEQHLSENAQQVSKLQNKVQKNLELWQAERTQWEAKDREAQEHQGSSCRLPDRAQCGERARTQQRSTQPSARGGPG